VISATVKMPDTVKTVRLRRGLGKTKAKNLSDEQIERRLKDCLGHLKPIDRSVLILTHMDIENRVPDIARRLKPELTFNTAHFWANRGINAYKGFDAVIALGTPSASPSDTLDPAMALFEVQAERDRWVKWLGEADLYQGVHRIRPIYGSKTIIILGKHWPTALGRPTLTIDQRRRGQNKGLGLGKGRGRIDEALDEAERRLAAFVEQHGFVLQGVALCMGIGQTKDKAIIKRFLHQVANEKRGKKSVVTRIKHILVGVTTLFEGGFSPVLFPDGNHWAELLIRLEARFPSLPRLRNRERVSNNMWIEGLGYLDSVRKFYDEAGKGFDEDLWTGVDSCTEAPAPAVIAPEEVRDKHRPAGQPDGVVIDAPLEDVGASFHFQLGPARVLTEVYTTATASGEVNREPKEG